MSFLKGLATGLTKFLKVTGVGKKALAPVAGKILPGPLGTAVGAGAGFEGSLMSNVGSGKKLGTQLKDAALTGVGTGLAATALGATGGTGSGGLLGKIGLTPGKAAQLGIAGLGALSGAQKAAAQGKITKEVLAREQAQQAQRDQIRAQLLGKIGAPLPTAPNLGSLYQGSSNPFARVQ